MSLFAYEGHFEGDRFISKNNLKIPEYKKAIVTIIEEESHDDIVKRQRKAFDEFIKNIKVLDDLGIEPLDEEFDKIISQRVNITRELDL
ncbi:MAG: hypothetical protein FWD71_06695 [Oscillospiraceae bacterium]|nr:hypothetical protein [Oscillospiraceae bacterium]